MDHPAEQNPTHLPLGSLLDLADGTQVHIRLAVKFDPGADQFTSHSLYIVGTHKSSVKCFLSIFFGRAVTSGGVEQVQTSRNVQIAGRKLAELRKSRYMTQRELAEILGVALGTVTRYEQEDRVGVLVSVFKKLAAFLKISPDELELKIGVNHAIAVPSGLSERPAETTPVPEWTIDLRASQWATVPIAGFNYDDEQERRIVDAGRFRLTVLGDCMEPAYLNGSMVEFQILRADEPYKLGHDYAICRSDGTATFKRLQRVDDDELVLAALNQRKYPGVLLVPRQEVCRIAIVVRRLLEAAEPGVLKISSKHKGK